MRITDLLDKRSISLDAVCASKSDALDQAVALMVKSGKINDEEAYRKQVYLREEESTTGIGEGIAIPHGKCDAVTKPGLAAMVIKDGVDFDSLDDEPVNLLFLIAAPNTEDNIHLDVLSKLSMLLMDENFVEKLKEQLLEGKTVNISGLGVFMLAAKSKGADLAKDITAKSVESVRICFQANKELKITKTATRAGEKLDLISLDDYLKGKTTTDEGSGDNSGGGSDGDENENPLG